MALFVCFLSLLPNAFIVPLSLIFSSLTYLSSSLLFLVIAFSIVHVIRLRAECPRSWDLISGKDKHFFRLTSAQTSSVSYTVFYFGSGYPSSGDKAAGR
jgi:hypothetical protein